MMKRKRAEDEFKLKKIFTLQDIDLPRRLGSFRPSTTSV
jgi:hypothetical protein